jgi:ElaB/YqjD/DUF883 family membrane-anchored ribosome-binding protein
MTRATLPPFLLSLGLMLLCLAACQRAYYGTMEAFGVHKREILVDRVDAAREDQFEAKEAFQDALERFNSVVNFHGGELEAQYDALKSQLDRCENRAEAVTDRITSIEGVAEALFREWEAELDEYTSPELRRRSRASLQETQERYETFIRAMYRAARKMDPVLAAFRDQVLFLKHNLNAQAVASLQGEVVKLETNVAELVAEMEQAIDEAEAFLAEMG